MFQTDREFEDEVRRIARILWPSAEFGGAEMIEGKERDGIFEEEEFVNYIECTTSRSLAKAKEDAAKLDKLLRKLGPKYRTKFLKGWFITLHEPTADQRAAVAKYQGKIVACSYDQFRAKLVDARAYLSQRKNYPFGSVRDPASDAALYDLKYIPLNIVDDGGNSHSIEDLATGLADGKRFVLMGDYGAGKSATSRELFLALGHLFWGNKTGLFPLLLNLRDHHGQTDPVEVIERHARSVGFAHPSSLVRAWRAGYCVVLLDGFDEIGSASWSGIAKRLRDLRYRSMELVRRFVRETPSQVGMLVVGRAHFFDSDRELGQALCTTPGFLRMRVTEFSPDQVAIFLRDLGWDSHAPEWLPTRPLLLAYLASRGLLSPDALGRAGVSPAVGWNELLDRIAAREAEIEAGIDPIAVRRLIEVLATAARVTADGLGPLSPDTIIDGFKRVCGYAPDDRAAVLLQRLPGLGGASAEDGSRVFIDRDYVDAARGGDLFHFVGNPYNSDLNSEGWQSTVRALGAEIAAYRCEQAGFSAGKVEAAIRHGYEAGNGHTLCADLLLILAERGYSYAGPRLFLKEIIVDGFTIEEGIDFSDVEFQDAVFGVLEIASPVSASMTPVFRRCYFARVEGCAGERDLPEGRFLECTFEEFEYAATTTKALLLLPLPLTTKVMLTALKKLYAQSGTGRKESALYRGLDSKAQAVVHSVLDLLRRHGFVTRTRQGAESVWLPTKTPEIRRRALSILASPTQSRDPLVDASHGL